LDMGTVQLLSPWVVSQSHNDISMPARMILLE
jgi:hypothetical protein